MKKICSVLLTLAMLLSALPAFAEGETPPESGASEGSETTQESGTPAATEIRFGQSSATVKVGETITLNATHNGGTYETVTYSVGDASVAEAQSPGVFLGKSAGTTTVYATLANGTSASCALTVQAAAIAPSAVSLNPSSATIAIGGKLQLMPAIEAGATTTYTYTVISGADCATVSENGLVTGVKAGTAIVQVTTANGKTANSTITVSAPVSYSVSILNNPLAVGQATQVRIADAQGNAQTASAYVSSNTAVATVDGSGGIRGVAAGNATITVTLPNNETRQLSLEVRVVPDWIRASPQAATLTAGYTTRVTVTADVAGSFAYTVASSNSAVVEVSASDPALLTAKSAGEAYITVTSYNGKTATFKITVLANTTDLFLNTPNRALGVGQSFDLVATDASGRAVACTYSSSVPAAVGVSNTGRIFVGAYLGTGTATITARAADGRVGSVVISTYLAPNSLTLGFGSNSAEANQYIVAGGLVMPAGKTFALKATVNAESSDQSVQYTSSNTSVATVSATGLVTARAAGTAVITARTYNGLSATKTVAVTGTAPGGTIPGGTIPSGGTSAIVTTASGSLNLREGASTATRALAKIPRGATITVHAQSGAWSQVSYGGLVGYVMSQYITLTGTPTPTNPPGGGTTGGTTQARVATQQGSLNLREYSMMGARVLARIPQYAYVTVTARGTTWCHVSYNGLMGYVMTQYLDFNAIGTGAGTGGTGGTTTPTGGTTAWVYTASGSLNLRERATTSSRVLTRIPRGAQVTVVGRGASWCSVYYGGYTGYAMTAFLSFEGQPPAITPTTQWSARVTTVTGSLNLRERDNLSAKVLTRIPQNAVVTVYTRGAVWCQVAYAGKTGYAMTRHLTFLTQ